MDRTKPEYLADMPRDNAGISWTVIVGIVLLIAVAGSVVIYVKTVERWNAKFGDAKPVPANAAPTPLVEAPQIEYQATAEAPTTRPEVDKCIDGVAFRRLPQGGWENLPGATCNGLHLAAQNAPECIAGIWYTRNATGRHAVIENGQLARCSE